MSQDCRLIGQKTWSGRYNSPDQVRCVVSSRLLAEGELDYLCLYFLATDLNGDLGLRLLVVGEDVAEGDALLERGRHGA